MEAIAQQVSMLFGKQWRQTYLRPIRFAQFTDFYFNTFDSDRSALQGLYVRL
jgi:hypothetical protein